MYVTIPQTPRTHQITLDDILLGKIPDVPMYKGAVTGTVTHDIRNITTEMSRRYDIYGLKKILSEFNEKHKEMIDCDHSTLYHTFYIPKKSGGLRRIDQPNPELMTALRELADIFQNKMNALYHTAAFAYVPGRCTVDAIKKHQGNCSKWFLKTDFSNFFGSTTPEFVMSMLEQIFPFCAIIKYSINGRSIMERAISLCFLNGGLPQGTPISPMLTNLMMIPMDFKLCNELKKKGFVYTRYADDILISKKTDFNYTEICNIIRSTLKEFHAPFSLKDEKTHYGSSAGKNWNLGLMLNKDNNITLGDKRKKNLRAMCFSFITDKARGVQWDKHDISVLSGQISYFKMVEPEYMAGFIEYFNNKHNVNLMGMIREELR